MLIGLQIRDVVLIETLDVSVGAGLTALTGETGAGKSIILDALGLAMGARGDAGLVRRGAAQAQAAAIFALPPDHPAWDLLEDKGLAHARDEDLVLRRTVAADGRSRAFVNDQATSVGVLRELGAALVEVHGQHETVGLLDVRTHARVLDAYGLLGGETAAGARAGAAWRAAVAELEALRASAAQDAAEAEALEATLADIAKADPRPGEEAALAEARAVLGASEKALADIEQARQAFDGLSGRVAQAARALEHARARVLQAGADETGEAMARLDLAAGAVERVFSEMQEAEAAVDLAARTFDFQPDQLEKTEERLFELRALARRLGVSVDELPALRDRAAARLETLQSSEADLKRLQSEAERARAAYQAAAQALTAGRRAAGDRLTRAVAAELAPLKLDKARFRATVEPLPEDRAGPQGQDRVALEIATNPGAPFGELGAIASGGELARLALALKAALAGRDTGAQPLMIFDEVDQGVGGAVADAVGLRLRGLARSAQVLVVTHSPQVAARADAHWRIVKTGDGDRLRTQVETLGPAEREEEIARMLAGAQVTDAARAAARALMHA